MAGPRDATGVFLRNGLMTVVDGRGNIWIYEPSITEDANGNPIVAPADFDRAYMGANSIMAIDTSGNSWMYNLADGTWSKGCNVDEQLPGEEDKIYEPWKQGYNVTHRAGIEEEAPPLPAAKSRSKREKEEA